MQDDIHTYFDALYRECPDEHTYLRVACFWLGLCYGLVAIALILALYL